MNFDDGIELEPLPVQDPNEVSEITQVRKDSWTLTLIRSTTPQWIWRSFSRPTIFKHDGDSNIESPSAGFTRSIDCSDPVYSPYVEWYFQFLSRKLEAISPSIRECLPRYEFIPAKDGLSSCSQKGQMFACLSRIAILLFSEHNLALAQIRDVLVQENLIEVEGDKLTIATQLTFILVGLLTMMYRPDLSPKSELLEMHLDTDITRPGTWSNSSVPFNCTNVSKPLKELLRQFSGHHGPIPCSSSRMAQEAGNDIEQTTRTPLLSSNICFYTLFKLAGVRIIWTESSCEHLEFDTRRKRLKLFCFPSFCGLISALPSASFQNSPSGAPELKITHVSRIFDDFLRDSRSRNRDHESKLNQDAARYHKEILESMRIIFGQDQHSYKLFLSSQALIDFQNGPGYKDGLLPVICGRNWSEQAVFWDIEAGPAKVVYCAEVDFPHLADRLVALQDFISTQCPHNLKTLYWDRRDITRFWTLWAVIYLGGITIILTLVQVALAAVQVAAGYLVH